MDFNQEQLAAIHSQAPNLLVLAGAGTGKTRTVIGRAQYLLASGVKPQRIAILTFTRRAAAEIENRLRATAGEQARGVIAGTFHRFCLRVMSSRRQWFGFDNLTVMDRDDQLQLMKLVRSRIAGKQTTAPPAAQLLSYYSFARNTNQSPKEYLEKFTDLHKSEVELVQKIFTAYRERKQQNSYFDYDDILHRFAKVLHDDPVVREKVASQYEHFLIDEMQDTNPLQWLILQSLAEYAHLFCVGDDAQSIYAFRGADFRNVHSFNERLPGATTLKLQQNYRSTQPILNLSNWLLGKSKLKYGKKLEAVRGDGFVPKLLEFESEYDEADWVVESIQNRRREGFEWNTNMILCRTAFVARPVEARLIEKKIPYRFVGGVSLLQMAHVRDLLSALRLAINFRDELAWMRFLTLWPRIGEVTASRILGQAVDQTDVNSAVDVVDAATRDRREITDVLRAAVANVDRPAKAIELVAQQLETLLELKYDSWDKRKRDFGLLGELASRHRSLSAFVETYTLDPVSASDTDPDDVEDILTLITVHSAKGTEADVCYVIGAQEGSYPHSRSQGDEDAVEEERRVLYVALTRARDELYITRSLSRGYSFRNKWANPGPSEYFLEVIPGDLVDSSVISHYSRRFKHDDDDVIG